MKWGTTELNIIKESYIPPYADAPVSVITVLPSGADNTTPNTVLQQGGRGRYQVSFDGFVRSFAEYNDLLDDYITKTARGFEGADGYSETMIISEFAPTGRTLFPLKINYSITLVEV